MIVLPLSGLENKSVETTVSIHTHRYRHCVSTLDSGSARSGKWESCSFTQVLNLACLKVELNVSRKWISKKQCYLLEGFLLEEHLVFQCVWHLS